MSEDTVAVPRKEYDRLIARDEKLQALEQGGVDNWEWYDQSMQDYFGDSDE